MNFGQIYWNQKVGLTSFTDESFENADSLGQVFDTLFRVEEKANVSFKQNLNPEISFGANYYLNKNMSVGALMRVQPVFQNLYSSFGLFFNARAAKWLGFSTGYIYSSRSHNIPLGLTLNPGPVQLYVITDNLLGFVAPTAARQFHLQAGINLTFGKTTRHWPEPPDEEEEIGFLIGEYNPPVAEESQPEPAEPGQPEPEKIGLPPRDTINMPEAGQEPLYKEEDADVTTYMVTNPIFLYRGPSSNTTVLDTIQPNTVMNVLQKRLPDWWYVEYGEQSGWIQPRSIRPSMELPPSVQEESDIPDPLVSFAPLQYIMLDDTPMREEPSETAGEIHLMKKWDEVLVLEKTNSRWWKIRHEGFEGYVKSPMLNPRPENYVRPEETKPAPSLVETYKPPVSSQGVFEVTESTSLRAQPTHESNALLRLRTGMKVNLLEKTSALWWKVEVNGLTGYAKAANLKQ